jgi:hypothetical protein
MVKRASVSLVVVILAAAGLSSFTQAERTPGSAERTPGSVACRHDTSENELDRSRRMRAIAVARAINSAEGELAERTRRYHPLAALRNLPPVPNGFELRLYSDVDGYVFAIKDTLDACRYAIFSDQSGLLYEKAARTTPIIAQ